MVESLLLRNRDFENKNNQFTACYKLTLFDDDVKSWSLFRS